MKAYALVQGPRRKVLAVSDHCPTLWYTGSLMFDPGQAGMTNPPDFYDRRHRRVCRQNGANVVRIDFTLGAPITTPRPHVARTKREAA
jgi:hypothetical protein